MTDKKVDKSKQLSEEKTSSAQMPDEIWYTKRIIPRNSIDDAFGVERAYVSRHMKNEPTHLEPNEEKALYLRKDLVVRKDEIEDFIVEWENTHTVE